MDMPQFDGGEDAYWWLICIEKHFDVVGTPESEKLPEAVKALRNRALKWWQWWSRRHLQANWKTFSVALLWHFKPEYRDLLPISYEEAEPELESELSAPHTLNLQKEETYLGNSALIQTVEERKKEKVEIPKVEDVENSLMNVIIEKQLVTKTNFCKFFGINRHFDEHGETMVCESMTRLSRTTIGESKASLKLDNLAPSPPPKPPGPDESLVKGGLFSGLIKPALLMPTAVMLCFWIKQTTQNRVYDPGISYYVSRLALSLCFK
ncbi:uncharacterized protein LOC131644368 isoform X1 [Vicia villosa]|uniref:uncharacterized protein LOC131644368 isoform X1 n=1 Tax=Vicia villosa TaxID=3911 RepID=UPI00273B744F|nr:uncharacterized protein LOC131644368 isoform X1 [Vicia villosa]XP_058770835.1 uncharacterized protein LOC131644368 isoform X1 [Vicia villosa]